jgi:ADP-heptose:LPS heptosyltransferase
LKFISKFHSEQFYFLVSAVSSFILNLFSFKKEVKNILVIKLDEIGDMAYAMHVFKHLKTQFPEAKITLLCKNFVRPLIANNPYINSIIQELPKATKFDTIVELRGNWQTLKYALKQFPVQRFDRGTIRIKNKINGKQKHETITNFEIIAPILTKGTLLEMPQLYPDSDEIEHVGAFIESNKLKRFVVLHCGARRVLRQWPVQNFALLVKVLFEKYQLQIVFAGTQEDESTIQQINQLSNIESFQCTRNFNLMHFACLVQKSALFIGNESGPLHLAAIMKTPLIGIYGPGVKDIFYPIGETSEVVHHVLECNPCDQITCVRPQNPCINLVTLAEVEQKIALLLEKNNYDQ